MKLGSVQLWRFYLRQPSHYSLLFTLHSSLFTFRSSLSLAPYKNIRRPSMGRRFPWCRDSCIHEICCSFSACWALITIPCTKYTLIPKTLVKSPLTRLADVILTIRDQNLILDTHLALLYGVETRALIQAVKRNDRRFPLDFMFQLTREEFGALRSQIVTSKGRGGRRHLPVCFHGARFDHGRKCSEQRTRCRGERSSGARFR